MEQGSPNPPLDPVPNHGVLAYFLADRNAGASWRKGFRCRRRHALARLFGVTVCRGVPPGSQGEVSAAAANPTSVYGTKVLPVPESVLFGQHRASLLLVHLLPPSPLYTAKRYRPLLRRALITAWPFLVRMRARKPDTLFLLRLVPCRVRWVIAFPASLILSLIKSHNLQS
jgi:hypothetical protein